MSSDSSHFHLGVSCQQAGELAKAESLFRQALRQDPRNAEAWYRLGDVCRRLGKDEESSKCYRQAIEIQPTHVEAQNNLGVALLGSSKPEEALVCFEQAIQAQPNYAEAHNNHGIALLALGDPGAALESFRQALCLRPLYPEARNNEGVALLRQGKLAEAVTCYREAVRLHPRYVQAHINLAGALRDCGQLDEAAASFKEALRLRPDVADTHNAFGVLLLQQEQYEAAARHFEEALRLLPAYSEARCNLGIAFMERGRHTIRQTVAQDSNPPTADSNLGQLLLDRGHAEAALIYAREALRLYPDSAEAHNHLGNVLLAMDHLAEARVAYADALILEPDLASAMASLGLTLHRDGQLKDAIPWLERAVELQPDNVSWWENLAELHMERDEYEQAAACCERVLDLKPERAATHNMLGMALQEQGHLSNAIEHFRGALRLDPNLAVAQLHIGGIHEELGELTEAEAAFREVLRIQPHLVPAHARLATLLRGKLSDNDLAVLEERLADHNLVGEPRANLLFGRAHVLDARGDYARAADCLREANALSLKFAKKRHRDYDPAQHEQFVDNMLKACDPAFFARLRDGGSDSRRPVFVFGVPRSGTTLTEQVLASHSCIHGAGELRLVRRSFESIPALLERKEGPVRGLSHLDGAAVRHLAEQHLQWLHEYDEGRAERVVNKMPDSYTQLGLIAVMFPNAVLIHCRRDLRDVAVSCYMSNFRSIPWASDPEHLGTRFTQYLRLMDHWRAVLPVTIHEVDYEDTVSDLEGVARRLVAACGLEWESKCLDFHLTRRPVRTASVTQVRQPIYSKSVARWRNYEHALPELFAHLPAPNGRAT